VLVRLGDDDFHYSAGARQPPPDDEDGEDFPGWPEHKQVHRRRSPGMEHLDLVSDEPIAWDVRFPRRVSARHAEQDAERLRDALARDADVFELRWEVERIGDRADAVLRFKVFARTHDEAMRLVLDIERRWLEKVPYPVEEIRGGAGWVMADPTGWNPMDDIRPATTETSPASPR
jgi:hypothetical protein